MVGLDAGRDGRWWRLRRVQVLAKRTATATRSPPAPLVTSSPARPPPRRYPHTGSGPSQGAQPPISGHRHPRNRGALIGAPMGVDRRLSGVEVRPWPRAGWRPIRAGQQAGRALLARAARPARADPSGTPGTPPPPPGSSRTPVARESVTPRAYACEDFQNFRIWNFLIEKGCTFPDCKVTSHQC